MSNENLDGLVRRGRVLLDLPEPVEAHRAFRDWDHAVAAWLDTRCPGSGLSAQWSSLAGSDLVAAGRYREDGAAWREFRDAIRHRLQWLSTIAPRVLGSVATAQDPASASTLSRIFLVHGRQRELRESVARYLERLELSVLVLDEQANKGHTIIEKLVEHSDVAFAVVLLTGDDVGRLAEDRPEAARPRARQNVILELGYFIGLLGRQRVCALYQPGVELPSDYRGVGLIEADSNGAWRLELARELQAARLPINTAKII